MTDPLGLTLEQAARPMVAATTLTASVAAPLGVLTGFPRGRMAPPPTGYLGPVLVPVLRAVESSRRHSPLTTFVCRDRPVALAPADGLPRTSCWQ